LFSATRLFIKKTWDIFGAFSGDFVIFYPVTLSAAFMAYVQIQEGTFLACYTCFDKSTKSRLKIEQSSSIDTHFTIHTYTHTLSKWARPGAG
jgi:hypothetical protein